MTLLRTLPGLPRSTRGQQALVVLVLALVPAFALTTVVVGMHRQQQLALAREWRERSETALRSGDAATAIVSLRNALRFARDDRDLRLRLSQALASVGRASEARAYLLGLWQDQPGNGRVNLELARLAARETDLDEARRFYTNAIQGAWAARAPEERRAARMELADLLVSRGANDLAEAELIALSSDLPPEPQQQIRVANLLARAGAHRRALAVYEQVLAGQPDLAEAQLGAGSSAFAVSDFTRAVRYLAPALGQGAGGDAAEILATSRAVLDLDPHRRGLSSRQRANRIARVLRAALARLKPCDARGASEVTIGPPVTPGPITVIRDELAARLKAATPRAVAAKPELLDGALLAAARAEKAAASCGTPGADDRAILLLAARAEGSGT